MAVDASRHSRSVLGMSLKHFTLVALTLQTSIHILVMHYSRMMPPVDGHRYIPSTAVFLNEVIKLPICLSMALYEIASNPKTPDTSTAAGLFGELGRAVFTGDSWKLAIPAMLYTLQNSLQYVAVGNLDAATFQITNQLKILSTAIFSVLMLRRAFSGRKWSSLVLLMLGVAIVHIPGGPALISSKDLRARGLLPKAVVGVTADHLSKRSATYEGMDMDYKALYPDLNTSLGFTAVALACFLSGLASVYFEKILKEPKNEYGNSVWIRNVQLSFYSIWPALFIGVMFIDGEHITKKGFFTGYNWVVWTAILLQAIGGLLVAFVVKFANNVTKNFATSISIILSFFVSVFFFDLEISPSYVVGTAAVLSATYLYNTPGPSGSTTAEAPRIRVPQPEEKESDQSYFDIDSGTTSHILSDAISTSRPNTPSLERKPRKVKSMGPKTPLREQ